MPPEAPDSSGDETRPEYTGGRDAPRIHPGTRRAHATAAPRRSTWWEDAMPTARHELPLLLLKSGVLAR